LTFFIGFLRATKIPVDTSYLIYKFPSMGMDLTNPNSVEGWPINKYQEAHESDYFLAFYPQYVNAITDAIRRMNYHDEDYTLDALLPSNRPTGGEAVDHIAYMLGVSLSRSERDDLVEYMDNKMGYEGLEPELFDPREPSQVRRKIAGLLWILIQHEDYMTY
jgi:hypothetical protein